jgi:hypothetical protein
MPSARFKYNLRNLTSVKVTDIVASDDITHRPGSAASLKPALSMLDGCFDDDLRLKRNEMRGGSISLESP